MKSRIFTGRVVHQRLTPVQHGFSYPLYFYGFDLDELPHLEAETRMFAYNRRGVVSIFDRDYLVHGPGSIKEKLIAFLKERASLPSPAAIELITSARYFNCVFNPANFYLCRDAEGRLLFVVVEVNNTFSETHLYLLDKPEPQESGKGLVFSAKKEFHVSPFHGMDWRYVFRFKDSTDKLEIGIDMLNQNGVEFHARLEGAAVPFSGKSLRGTLLRFPFSGLLNFPRILVQAARLYFGKKLRVYHKPVPSSEWTIKTAPPTLFQRIAMTAVRRLFEQLEKGCLAVELPDKQRWQFGDAGITPPLRLKVRDYHFFSAVLWGSDIGLGDSFVDGAWETDDLPALLRLGAENSKLYSSALLNSRLLTLGSTLLHRLRRNTLRGSRRNIAAHYDLSNEFFQLFLDSDLNYSSAVFNYAEESLEDAQQNKIDLLLRKLQIRPEEHLLEIGSGWGCLALRAARDYGCRVTAVTVSQAQCELAAKRVAEAGLQDRVKIKLCDYRELSGAYDKIISVEMLEAAGKENLGRFFGICDRLLKPNGLIVLQVITMPEQRYRAYSRRCDWIQRHIFPGGHVPSLEFLSAAIAGNSSFCVEHAENIGIHYAETLRRWRSRFVANQDNLVRLGFSDRFIRKWLYYFAYCEAAFESRLLGNHQLVLSRSQNTALPQWGRLV